MGNYYLTVSGDANDIVTSPVALPTSSVTPYGAAAPLSGSYVTTTALSATPNSRILGVSGGDLVISEDSSSVTLESAFTSATTRALVLTGGSYTTLSALEFCSTGSGILSLTYNHSAGTPAACPIPNPYIWMTMITDGTNDTANVDFGDGGTVSGVSSTGDMHWDHGTTRLFVSATGIYRVLVTGIMTVAGSTNVVLKVYRNSNLYHSTTMAVHNPYDPDMGMLDWIGYVEAGEHIRVTRDPDVAAARFTAGSTVTVTRMA